MRRPPFYLAWPLTATLLGAVTMCILAGGISGCVQQTLTSTGANASGVAAGPQPHTIAHEILAIEAPIADADPSRSALLNAIIVEARSSIGPYTHRPATTRERDYAMEVFRSIDGILTSRHFVYPAHGQVDTLSAGLTPTVIDPASAVEWSKIPANARRARVIETASDRRFCVVDCDIASYIYLAVGEDLHLPISMVSVPGHMFVRWDYPATPGVPGGHVDFETTLGVETADWMYARSYAISDDAIDRGIYLVPLSRQEVLGYCYGVRGEIRCRRREYARGLQDLRRASFLYPRSPEVKNLLAWTLATCPLARYRNGTEAREVAESLLRLDRRANGLDTLASAYAETGDFENAVKTERQARDMAHAPGATARDAGLDYDGLIAAYERHVSYVQHHAGNAAANKSVQARR